MQRLDATVDVAHIEPLDQHETENIMQVQDTLPTTDETATDEVAEHPTPRTPKPSETSDQARSIHRHWRWITAIVATVALVGIATVADRDQGPDSTPSADAVLGQRSDGSFDVNEAKRMAALRDLATGQRSDGSFDVNEANRMAALRD